MKNFCIFLSLLLFINVYSRPQIYVAQPQPSTNELSNFFSNDFSLVEGVKLSLMLPQPLDSYLRKNFRSPHGKRLLQEVRAYNKPALDKEDIQHVKDVINKSSFKPIFVENSAVVSHGNFGIMLPLRGISERKSSSDIYNPISFEQQSISNIPAYLTMKRIIEIENLGRFIEVPKNMYLWYYGNIINPGKKVIQLSDRDYIVVYQKVDQLDLSDPQDQQKRQHFLHNLSLDQIRTLEILIDKAGLWRLGNINFNHAGKMIITDFQQPDNTVSASNMNTPGVFFNNSITKRAWNRYVGFEKLKDLLPPGQELQRVSNLSKTAFILYEKAKAIETEELKDAYRTINDEYELLEQLIAKNAR